MRRLLPLLAAAGLLVFSPAASAATLSFSGGVLAYVGVDAPETVTVESITSGVKFFDLVAGQIAAPLPTGCSATNNVAGNSQIVTCTPTGITKLTFALGAGDDTLIANGLSKPTEMHGGAGRDAITGGSQADAIYGDGDVDTINSGPAVDSIFVRDGLADLVDCGGALDNLQGDTIDTFKGCESSDLSADLVPDADGDGVKPPADCDDHAPGTFPGAVDVPGDGIDQNCDGKDAVAPAAPVTPVVTPVAGASPAGAQPAASAAGAAASGSAASASSAAASGSATAATIPAASGALVATTLTAGAGTGTSKVGVTTGPGGRPEALPRVAFALLPRRGGSRFTRATKLTVAAVAPGATLRVSCKGTGCPPRAYRKTFRTGAQHLVIRSLFSGARLRAGVRIDARITLPGALGRSVRYRVNGRATPDSEVRCLAAVGHKPVAC